MRGLVTGVAVGILFVGLAVACRVAAPPGAPQRDQAASNGEYAGAEACKECHSDAFETFAKTRMGRLFLKGPRDAKEGLACENCHGPGKAHVDAGGGRGVGGLIAFSRKDKTPVERRNVACLQCHVRDSRVFWQGSPHESRDIPCTGCHRVMQDVSPRAQLAKPTEIETCGQCHLERRAQQMRSSHMPLREGKMTCSSCHVPHGSVTPALLKENSANETCYTCHAEKRGPFLWEHPPVTESCTNCHDPHGSNHEAMLKVAKPRLCQQCHVETLHPTRPYGRDTGSLKFVLGKSCTNCHVNVHGSNHPSGSAFTR